MLASGGVCAVLDYEIDQITEYVAEMAQRIVLPGTPVSPAFRKFVSGLLSSTRLPSTTILLGMNYLARRMNMLNAAGPYKATDGVVWRMLTIGLLLGSKFLDDNTFQNRSWSEVSGIAVSELNTLEHEWLDAMGWSLYVNLDESNDFKAWMDSWKEWREAKTSNAKQLSIALHLLLQSTPTSSDLARTPKHSVPTPRVLLANVTNLAFIRRTTKTRGSIRILHHISLHHPLRIQVSILLSTLT
jgi:hypothetical protein